MGNPSRCPWAVWRRGGDPLFPFPHGDRVQRGCGNLPRLRWGQFSSARARSPWFMSWGVRTPLALLLCAGNKAAACSPLPEIRTDAVTTGEERGRSRPQDGEDGTRPVHSGPARAVGSKSGF